MAGDPLRFQIHPVTAKFIDAQFDEDKAKELGQETYLRAGTYLEKQVLMTQTLSDLRDGLDAGYYLLQCGEFDRSLELLGRAAATFQSWGMVLPSIAALKPFEQAQVIERISPESRQQLFGTLGIAYHYLGQVEMALGYGRKSLDIAKERGDRESQGVILGNLGGLYSNIGQTEKAIEHYKEARDIAEETGNRLSEINQLVNLGLANLDLGEEEKDPALTDEAIAYLRQALDMAKEIAEDTGDRRPEGNALGGLGAAYALLGKLRNDLELIERGVEYLEQALVIAKQTGDRRSEEVQLGNLGAIYSLWGDFKKAIEHYHQALTIAKKTENKRGEAYHSMRLGMIYADLDQVDKAREYLKTALAIAQRIKDPKLENKALEILERLKEQ